MAIPKPWRPPKKQKDMDRGRKAHRRGKEHQRRVAKFLGMKDNWPFPGIDIEGKVFCLSAKSREEGYPETVEKWLEDAEIMTTKKRPGSVAVLNIHKTGGDKRDDLGRLLGIRMDLVVMRLDSFRWILEKIEGGG